MKPIPRDLEHRITYRVRPAHIVHRIFPGVAVFADKPPVMASGFLAALCEWPAMEALAPYLDRHEYCVGHRVSMEHLRPIEPGTALTAVAHLTIAVRRRSSWTVVVCDARQTVALAEVGLAVLQRQIPAVVGQQHQCLAPQQDRFQAGDLVLPEQVTQRP